MSALLIADDSADKRQLMCSLAAVHWPGVVAVATTSEEAMDLLSAHDDIGAALVDFYIPSTNGPAIIAAVKAAFPRAKIALVSSANNAQNAAAARLAGADEVVCTSLPNASDRLADLLSEWAIMLG